MTPPNELRQRLAIIRYALEREARITPDDNWGHRYNLERQAAQLRHLERQLEHD